MIKLDGRSDMAAEGKSGNGLGNGLAGGKDSRATSLKGSDLRNAAYFILFIASAFMVNAMEAGSYRTPWPVAVITLIAGIGLYGYSFIVEKNR